jgi:hypothetical protein
MPLEVVRHPQFDGDFLSLPFAIRDECWRVVGVLRRRPFAPGLGFRVEKLRRITTVEAWSAHFLNNQYRLLYVVDGEHLILFGVGARPGFYRRLDRLRRKNLHPS